MEEPVKYEFNPEAGHLEVTFSAALGYMRDTENHAVVEPVDLDGNLLGFSILAVGQLANLKLLKSRDWRSISTCSNIMANEYTYQSCNF